MEANLLAAEPSALQLRVREHGGEQQQPREQANDEAGKNTGVERSTLSRSRGRAASMTVVASVAVVQLLWVALLVYVAYSAVTWLPL